jgi:hypothetical protein
MVSGLNSDAVDGIQGNQIVRNDNYTGTNVIGGFNGVKLEIRSTVADGTGSTVFRFSDSTSAMTAEFLSSGSLRWPGHVQLFPSGTSLSVRVGAGGTLSLADTGGSVRLGSSSYPAVLNPTAKTFVMGALTTSVDYEVIAGRTTNVDFSSFKFSGSSSVSPTSGDFYTIGHSFDPVQVAASNYRLFHVKAGSALGTSVFSVLGNGNIGVNRSSPVSRFEVGDAATSVSLPGVTYPGIVSFNTLASVTRWATLGFGFIDSNSSPVIGAKIGSIITNRTAGSVTADMAFSTRVTGTEAERMRLTSSGLGLGTQAPVVKLHVHSTTINTHALLSGTAPGLRFSNLENGTERAVIGLASTLHDYVLDADPNDLAVRVTDASKAFRVGVGPTNAAERFRVSNNLVLVNTALGIKDSYQAPGRVFVCIDGDTGKGQWQTLSGLGIPTGSGTQNEVTYWTTANTIGSSPKFSVDLSSTPLIFVGSGGVGKINLGEVAPASVTSSQFVTGHSTLPSIGLWNTSSTTLLDESELMFYSGTSVSVPVKTGRISNRVYATSPNKGELVFAVSQAGVLQSRVNVRKEGVLFGDIDLNDPECAIDVNDGNWAGLVVRGANLGIGPIFTSFASSGFGMFFSPRHLSFRGGQATGTQWADGNLGNHSFGYGRDSKVLGLRGAVLGGDVNTIFGTVENASILGGLTNTIGKASYSSPDTAPYDSSIIAGRTNTILGNSLNATGQAIASVILGGISNTLSGSESVILAGDNNINNGQGSVVGGTNSSVGNGTLYGFAFGNDADVGTSAHGSFALGQNAGIGNSSQNSFAFGTNANVGAGGTASNSFAFGSGAAVQDSVNGGDYCVAMGRRALANDQGCFVFSDSTDANYDGTTKINSFGARFDNGFSLETHVSLGSPTAFLRWGREQSDGGVIGNNRYLEAKTGTGVTAYLTDTGTWTSVSDRDVKENFIPVDSFDVLNKIKKLPVCAWNFKADGQKETIPQHIGPTAQDFMEAFHLGSSDRHIESSDIAGVTIAAVKGLIYQLEAKDREIQSLSDRLARLESKLLNA